MRAGAFLGILLVVGCADPRPAISLHGAGTPAAMPPAAAPADWPGGGLPATRPLPLDGMKGYELYSARSRSGDWHFFLVPGTNRMKSAEELVAAGSIVGAAAIAARLATLPKEASVSWIHGSAPLHLGSTLPGLGLPPADAMAAIQAAAREAGVVVIVD